MQFKFSEYLGKRIKLIDIDNQVFVGTADFVEDPNNSEDGKWWLNVDVPGFGELTIPESEIKSIELLKS